MLTGEEISQEQAHVLVLNLKYVYWYADCQRNFLGVQTKCIGIEDLMCIVGTLLGR